MKTLNALALSTVSGGTSKNDQLTTALTNIQSSIKDVTTQKPALDPTMLMVLMMSQRQQAPTVVAAPSAAAGPVVNISTRVRRGW